MVDNFKVEPSFENRQHKRHQFGLDIDGRHFKGDYHEDEIHWLNPHPKQHVGAAELKAIEMEVHKLLDEHGLKDENDDIEIEPMLTSHAQQLQKFKLVVQGEEFKGTFNNGKIEWFHPKPRRKLNNERVEKVEEKVQEKMKEHLD